MKKFEVIVTSDVDVFENSVIDADDIQAAIASLDLKPHERLLAIAETPNEREPYFTQLYLDTWV